MRVVRLRMANFRGIKHGEIHFGDNVLLVGGNNSGKSTVCEALDLVLGPERLNRRPVVDEHDFHRDSYLTNDGEAVVIEIEAILVDLTDEAIRRFGENHLRHWNVKEQCYADEGDEGPLVTDRPEVVWALPVVFFGRYELERDDFEGDSFFAYPVPEVIDDDEQEIEEQNVLGSGRTRFTWSHKRFCGFLFLRALRTGSRALSLQRGSLLDTIIRLGGTGLSQMWGETLYRLRNLQPAIGDIQQLNEIQSEVRDRIARFVQLADDKNATGFFASDLTRNDLRNVVKFFLASKESDHLVPFQKLGTGTINVLVFALLTFIAELKDRHSVIFAMEEPEIALPPHTQRRVTKFVLQEMGQAIVTSHSPYVIEQFELADIVILEREQTILKGNPVNIGEIKEKTYKTNRRQFAEAVLSRAVLVVEGSTEASVFSAAATVIENTSPTQDYTHPDLAGIVLFNAGGYGDIPRYGPAFAALGKPAFAVYDKPNNDTWSVDDVRNMESYDESWESPFYSIEELLVTELSVEVQRSFLNEARHRSDYPQERQYSPEMSDDNVKDLCKRVLKARKGEAHGYAANLIEHCKEREMLPDFIRTVLEALNLVLDPPVKSSEEGADCNGDNQQPSASDNGDNS